MQAESAPNSDSTIRYSHGARSPAPTRSDRASTMWVCGEIGYAATTCGRHRATVSATARDPSSCLSNGLTPTVARLVARRDEVASLLGQSDVGFGNVAARAGEPSADRTGDSLRPQQASDARDGTDKHRVRQWPPEQPTGELVG